MAVPEAAFGKTVIASTSEKVQFRESMRLLAGAVCVIATEHNGARGGLTATAVTSFTADPPQILLCVNRNASAYPSLCESGKFTINLLREENVFIAQRFAGLDGSKGTERFDGAKWEMMVTGAPALADSLASIDCRLVELIERNGHGLIIGSVVSTRIRGGDPLVYVRQNFHALKKL